MNYLAQIEQIKQALRTKGHGDLADSLREAQLAGGTGGEALISVCAQLLRISREAPSGYALIAAEADTLIKYANSIGLYPE